MIDITTLIIIYSVIGGAIIILLAVSLGIVISRHVGSKKAEKYLEAMKTDAAEMPVKKFLKLRLEIWNRGPESDLYKQAKFEGVYIIINKTKNKYYINHSKSVLDSIRNHFAKAGSVDIYIDYVAGDEFTVRAVALAKSRVKDIALLEQIVTEKYALYNKREFKDLNRYEINKQPLKAQSAAADKTAAPVAGNSAVQPATPVMQTVRMDAPAAPVQSAVQVTYTQPVIQPVAVANEPTKAEPSKEFVCPVMAAAENMKNASNEDAKKIPTKAEPVITQVIQPAVVPVYVQQTPSAQPIQAAAENGSQPADAIVMRQVGDPANKEYEVTIPAESPSNGFYHVIELEDGKVIDISNDVCE